MRSNSGMGKGENNDHDPTLKEHAGQGGPGPRDQRVARHEGFEVAADDELQDGERSPGARGRGEVASADQVVPSGD